jgi:acyl-CoA synthetase (AMP-forming)/AMP-acid ligase II
MDLTSIKMCFSGGAPMPGDVIESFEARTGARIAEAYGMTEASSVTHVNPRWGVRKFSHRRGVRYDRSVFRHACQPQAGRP